MRINNNIMSLNAHRQLGMNQAGASKSMEKLSSGFRINRAGDDAAGLAISEKMRGQIRGLKQATRNAQDGISLIQTAEGALNETHAILQRMRELAVQSSTDTNNDQVDREAIEGEIKQLISELDRIGTDTEFNKKTLLDGSIASKKVPGVDNAAVLSSELGAQKAAVIEGTAINPADDLLNNLTENNQTIYVDGAKLTVELDTARVNEYKASAADGEALASLLQEDINAAIDAYNEAKGTEIEHVSVSYSADKKVSITSGSAGAASSIETVTPAANDLFDLLGIHSNIDAANNLQEGLEGTFSVAGGANVGAIATGDKSTVTIDGVALEVTWTSVGGLEAAKVAAGADMSDAATAIATDINSAINAYNLTVPAEERLDNVTASVKDGAFVVQSGSEKATSSIKFDKGESAQLLGLAGESSSSQGGGIYFQIGANELQHMQISIGDMRAGALGVEGIDLSNREGASEAITTIENAITKVSTQRSELGAFQNRLEHTISNLGTSAENLQAAESRIRDLDMAEEIMAFTKNNILQQAATAMLAQANMAPQSVLQLLG